MHLHTTSRTTATAAALLAAATFAGSAGAAAAEARGFDLTTAKGANGGQAHGYGSVVFTTAKKVRITGRINDLCPKDGYGAYIEFKVNFVGGGYGTTIRSDQTRCAGKAVAFEAGGTFAKRIKSVGVTVIEIDQTKSGPRYGDAARKLIGR